MKSAHMGGAMRIARERREVQQQALATKLHMSPPCLSKVECGRKPVTQAIVAGYVCNLGCPHLADLYCDECPVRQARAKFTERKAS